MNTLLWFLVSLLSLGLLGYIADLVQKNREIAQFRDFMMGAELRAIRTSTCEYDCGQAVLFEGTIDLEDGRKFVFLNKKAFNIVVHRIPLAREN